MITEERLDSVAHAVWIAGILLKCIPAKSIRRFIIVWLKEESKKRAFPCKGCRRIAGMCPVIKEKCRTCYTCLILRNITYCFESMNSLAWRLPSGSWQSPRILPHNLKVFNCAWLKIQELKSPRQTSSELKLRYFKGKVQVETLTDVLILRWSVILVFVCLVWFFASKKIFISSIKRSLQINTGYAVSLINDLRNNLTKN